MKQTNLLKGLLAIVALLCSAHSWAYAFSAKNDDGKTIYYNYSGTEATVTYGSSSYNYELYSGNVVIPETVTYGGNTYTVTAIGDKAFHENSYASSSYRLTSVTIPNSVTSIGSEAFAYCTGLTEIDIPNSVTSIGGSAFYCCTGLTELTIGNSVTSIGSSAFYGCTGLAEVTIPENVTTIGDYAFQSCSYLAQINFDATACATAGSSSAPVFNSCTSLITINIGESVTIIPSCLFYGCTWVTRVTIPNSVTSIGGSAFYNCTGLTELTIGNSVTSIGSSAFYGCTGLTEITIPNMVAEIGGSAFYGCSGITEVNYNAIACTSAGSSSSYGFGGCGNVVSLIIGENVTTIPAYAFYGCTNLTEINSLSTVPPTILGAAFQNVVNVEVPMEALNKYALADIWTDIPRIYAKNNEKVYYPVPISYDGAAAITAVDGNEDGTVATESSTVEFNTMEGNNLAYGLATHVAKDITDELLNEGKYSLTVSAYHKDNTIYCYSPAAESLYDITLTEAGQVLDNITVSNINSVSSLKLTGDINGTDIYAIRRMTSLKTLDLSDANVVSGGNEYYGTNTTSNNQIGSYFFYDMPSLKRVILPNSATSIGSYAFGYCADLRVMTIHKNISSIANNAFGGCTSLEILTFEDGENSLSLSSSVFQGCPIVTMHIGRDIAYSGSTPQFENLKTLTSLTLGGKVSSVKDSEFEGCSSLSALTIGNGVTSIGDRAFYGCSGMTCVTIGSSVSSIGGYAFYGCASLAEINVLNPAPPEIVSNTFTNVNKETCVLNVPTGCLNAYWLDRYWNEFLNISDNLPNGISGVVNNGNAKAIGYYTLDGKQVPMPTPQRGVNIIRYSDGTVRKVLVK